MSTDRTETVHRPFTLEEFERLPEEDRHTVELVRGFLVREPRPGAEHGWLVIQLGERLNSFVRERRLGIVFTETGFVLGVDPPTVRGPDLAFVAAERLPPGGPPRGFWQGAPDLAVEIVSPSNTVAQIREKVLEYLSGGTRLAWVVDPETRSVSAYRSRKEILLLTEDDALEGGDVIPGFQLTVRDLFTPFR